MIIPDAQAAANKEWEKLEKILAWNLEKMKSEKDVILEAQKEKRKVFKKRQSTFATLMDICHLKNAELEQNHEKYKGRVVPRGDFVKDDSGAYAVFTEQGSSASQMTAAKSNGRHCEITRMRWTSRRPSVSIHPSKNGGR